MAERDRAELILTAAGRLFMTQGISATTIRQIAKELGTVSGTLYYYYPSKESIASTILHRFLDDLNVEYAAFSDDPDRAAPDLLRELVRTSMRVASRHPFATEIYQNEGAGLTILPDHVEVRAKRDVVQGHWRRIIDRGVQTGELRADVDPDHFRWLLRELTWLTVRWHRPTLAEDHEPLADELVSMFLDGFATR
ncbi:TetR/AcrR family transcriptional regulator [Nocardioides sp. W7]|uniref:TetR/AcrR family transcriptional regulator n=1 Tax=Nocardioides sp. W7 TaxID=2931390 RepID=UPI001FD39F00|nr:TetR/AcrR family transcriptional regulator [Nocardioides sp. W7]